MTEYERILHEEGGKYGWGLILIYPDLLQQVLTELKKRVERPKILDVGAWKCMLRKWLLENVGDVDYVGVDVIELSDRDKDAEFKVMSPVNLLFPPESFDVVIMLEVLEHIQDYTLALREAYRVLGPKGLLFIQSVKCTDPNALYDRTHFHVLHPVTLSRLLSWIGFKNIAIKDGSNFVVIAFK